MKSTFSPEPAPGASVSLAAYLPRRRAVAKVKLSLFGRPDTNLQHFVAAHLQAMQGNARFPEPLPSQDDLAALLAQFSGECQEAQSLLTAYRSLISRKNAARKRLSQAMDRRGAYVQSWSSGDAAAILSAGFGVIREPRPIGPLPPPGGLVVQQGQASGTVTIRWNKVPKCRGYLLSYREREAPLDSWEQRYNNATCHIQLSGLKPATCYVFRVATSFSGGQMSQSPWSPEVIRAIG